MLLPTLKSVSTSTKRYLKLPDALAHDSEISLPVFPQDMSNWSEALSGGGWGSGVELFI